MNIKSLATSLLVLSSFVSTGVFAAETKDSNQAQLEALKAEYQKSLEAAAKSSDVRGGLVKACSVKYKTAIANKALTQADVNKLCDCSVTAEGQTTSAQTWELQSAVNAKNKTKYQQLEIAMLKKQSESIKRCVGVPLDQKLTKLAQQAQQAQQAAAPTAATPAKK